MKRTISRILPTLSILGAFLLTAAPVQAQKLEKVTFPNRWVGGIDYLMQVGDGKGEDSWMVQYQGFQGFECVRTGPTTQNAYDCSWIRHTPTVQTSGLLLSAQTGGAPGNVNTVTANVDPIAASAIRLQAGGSQLGLPRWTLNFSQPVSVQGAPASTTGTIESLTEIATAQINQWLRPSSSQNWQWVVPNTNNSGPQSYSRAGFLPNINRSSLRMRLEAFPQ